MLKFLNSKIKRTICLIYYFFNKEPFEKFILYSSSNYYKYFHKIDYLSFKLSYKLFARNSNDFSKDALSLSVLFKEIFLCIMLSAFTIILILCINDIFNINSYFVTFFDLKEISTTYLDILLVSIQILGIFLGLYFTVISVVLSTSYANVAQRIRSILLNEEIGRKYVKIVSYAGSFTLMLIGLFLFFNIICSLGIFLVLILSLVSLFGFLKSMAHFFNLLSPVTLMTQIVKNIKKNIILISSYSKQYNFKKIQKISQKNVENYLLALFDILNDINLNDKNDNDLIETISEELIDLLLWYSKIKFKIPLNSNWFRVKFEEKSWTFYDFRSSTEIEIAKKSKTATSPELINDFYWFEDDILKIFKYGLNIPIGKEDFETAGNIVYNLNNFIKRYISCSMGFKSYDYLEMINEILNKVNLKKHDENHVKNLVSIVDIYGYLIVESIISLRDNLYKFTEKEFYDKISLEIIFNTQLNNYNYALPLEVINTLENLYKFLQFEKDIEGKIITPKDIIIALLAASFSQYFKNILYKTLDEIDSLVLKTSKNLFDKNSILGISLIFRGIEANKKLELEYFEGLYEELKKFNKLEVSNWQNIEWKELKNRKNNFHYHLLKNLSDMVLLIDDDSFKLLNFSIFPDYLGKAAIFLSDDCYSTMETNDFKLFNEIFHKTFLILLLIGNKIINNEKLPGKDKTFLFRENLMKFIHLSSYAVFYSELYKNNYWEVVIDVWNKYSEDNFTNSEKMIEFLDKIIESRPVGLSAQNVERGEWEQSFKSKIKELLGDKIKDNFPYSVESIEHDSYIIRFLIKNNIDSMWGIGRYSICKYLIDNPKIKPKLSSETNDLLKQLKKEKENES